MRKPGYQQLPVVPLAQGEREESIPLSPEARQPPHKTTAAGKSSGL